MSNIARSKEQMLFVTLETAPGTFVVPATADCVVTASSITATQSPSYTDSPEIQNTRGKISRFQDALSAGDFNFSIIPRVNALGVAPEGAPLFESLMGLETVNASTSVVYSQTLKKPSISIAYRKGHVVYYLLGATVHKMDVTASKKGPVTLALSGKFMNRLIMGDDDLAALASVDATTIEVADAGRFMVGGKIYNPTKNDTNGGNGYDITAVNTTTNELTITDGAAGGISMGWDIADEIKGFLPTEQMVGTPIEGRDTVIKIDGSAGLVKDMSLSIDDPCQYLEDEINGEEYPTEYVEGDRNISGSLTSYFRKENSSTLVSALTSANEVPLAFELGKAGSMMKIDLPKVPLEAPSESEDGPTINLAQNFTALETDGEDSATITFS